ncbi:MAG: ABC transporter permease [Lachnospiraceae bacterium]|nr:ABC transporter permease [Lachnospiraceae bacterium]
MAEFKKELFVIKGKDLEEMETISRPSLTFFQDAWRRFRKNKTAMIGLFIIALYALLSIFAPILSQYEYTATNSSLMNALPSLQHPFGCDSVGRDLWVRVWRGGRVSLSIGLVSALVNMCVGAVIGGLCGYYGGKLDMIVMRIVDILYGIPSLIITILVMMVLGKGVMALVVALCIVGWIGTCRFVRGEVYRLKEQDFVLAAKVMGVSDIVIILRHIIPNILGMMITNMCMAIPGAIFQEAFLSYIGVGIAAPDCSWGVLANEGIQYLIIYPQELYIPAMASCTTMLALNLLGDGLRDAVDPKLRGTE